MDIVIDSVELIPEAGLMKSVPHMVHWQFLQGVLVKIFDEFWGSTDGDDLESKKKLGQLMSSSGWLKEDGFADNKSGFNPAHIPVRLVKDKD